MVHWDLVNPTLRENRERGEEKEKGEKKRLQGDLVVAFQDLKGATGKMKRDN